ncbi:MAG: tetratricopeptide repeat protein [Acidobacteriota bacterium]
MASNGTSDLWLRAAKILGHALDLPTSERGAYVAEACGGDRALRREVERLLVIDTSVADAYDRPIFDFRAGPVPRDPDRIAGFELSGKIGEGGMSTVFRGTAAEEGHSRPVAIKVLRRGLESEEMIRRFRREGEILAGLRHPYIVALHGGGMLEDGRPYLVMPLVEGLPVDAFCGPLNLGQRLNLFAKICDAVQYAHRSLVVHRDLKPSNILITADGEPRLLDFGISTLLDPLTDHPLTRTRTDLRLLTPAYAAPEQISGGAISTACDVYALGTLLYELTTNRRPFGDDLDNEDEGLSERALLAAKCAHDPVRPSDRVDDAEPSGRQLRRQLRGDLDAIVLQAMALRPQDRYESVGHLAEDLRRHLENRPVRARPGRWTYRAGKFLARHRLGLALAGVVVLALSAVTLERERQRSRAEQAVQRAESVKGFLTSILEEAEPVQGSGLDVPLRQVLAGSSRRLADLADEPEVQTELMLLLGSIYLSLEEPEVASPLLEDGWRIRRAVFGPDDPSTAEGLCALGRRDLLSGELDAAEERLGQAVAVLRRSATKGSTNLAYCLNELANVHERRPDFEAAERVYREAYETALHQHGPAGERTLIIGINLANLLRQRGQLVQSEALLEELIRRFDAAPVGAVVHGLALSNLAVVRFQAGHTEGAESAFRQSLELYRRILGPAHPKTLVALSNLSMALRDLGQLDEAHGLLKERLALVADTAGKASPVRAKALEDLGALEQRQGLLNAAEEHLRQGLELNRLLHGDDHLKVATAANSLGSVLLTADQPTQALELFAEAARLRSAALGEDHPSSAISLANRGRAQTALSRFRKAQEDLELAHGRLRDHLGAEHWITALAAAWRARASRLAGDLDAARVHIASAIERLEANPSWSPVSEQIRVEWAVQELEEGRRYAAARALETALQRLEPAYGEAHPWPVQVRLLLAESLAEDDPEASRQLLGRIQRDWPPNWGPAHWRRQQVEALHALTDGGETVSLGRTVLRLQGLADGSDPVAAATARRLLPRLVDAS